MTQKIDQDRVLKLINNKTVQVLDVEYCISFDKFVCDQYTWDEGYQDLINWEASTGFKQIKQVQLFSNDAKEFIYSIFLSKYDYLAIIYGVNQPGVVGKYNDIINNLSELSFHTPWVEYIVGAKKNKYGIFELSYNDFIEVWTGKCTMTAPIL